MLRRWLPTLRVWGLSAGLIFLGVSLLRAADPDGTATTLSRSGQFVVHGTPGVSSSAVVGSPSRIKPVGENANVVLRPDLLAVTAERVRKTVLTQFGLPDGPGSKVHLNLRRRRSIEGQLQITPAAFASGWIYRVDLPDEIEWNRLMRVLVEVALLDVANRNNPNSVCATVPLWLSEGMDCLLYHEYGRDLVPEAETLLNRSARRRDPLVPLRAALGGSEPEGFGVLTQVELDQLRDPARFALYRANAGLLVAAWLQDDTGRQHGREFLRQLPAHFNWQTAFLRSSAGRFESLLEVEKWWAVAVVSLLSQDPTQQWPRDRVITELRWILTETAEVRESTNAPAGRRSLTLGEIVRTWEYSAQKDVLLRKATQLQRLAVHAPPDLVPLLANCFQTLDGYLTARNGAGVDPISRTEMESRGRILAKTTSRKLDELDRQIAARP